MKATHCLAAIVALALAACKDAAAPVVKVDPPAAVHVVNTSGQSFNAYTVVAGSDLDHSTVVFVGFSDPACPIGGGRFCDNPLCLFSAQVNGERHFIQVAVVPDSPLDSLLSSDHDPLLARDRTPAFYDSLASGTLTPAVVLAGYAGLIIETSPFDPAPPGFAFPPDTVPWRWTVDSVGTAIAVDTSDHACR